MNHQQILIMATMLITIFLKQFCKISHINSFSVAFSHQVYYNIYSGEYNKKGDENNGNCSYCKTTYKTSEQI